MTALPRKKLPIGIQNLREIREGGYYYVDKSGLAIDLIDSGKLFADIGQPPLDPATDRAMICGSPGMLEDTRRLLDERGFVVSPRIGEPGDYVIERAFVEK